MTDQFDRAQELETLFRNAAISNRPILAEEKPDEDEDGNRYCLSCGSVVPPERIGALPNAVRCVSCQSRKEL
ncbi:TPA: TraR/DksA C4-type zinc finger protein [Vibrio parahaemolyticus]|nr:TraR/DksA C4-type zinc finger protein [Vibrio parahaemolyticus]